jgi:hypothetical protein
MASAGYKWLLGSKHMSDFTLVLHFYEIKQGSKKRTRSVTEQPVHGVVLSSQSEYFREELLRRATVPASSDDVRSSDNDSSDDESSSDEDKDVKKRIELQVPDREAVEATLQVRS